MGWGEAPEAVRRRPSGQGREQPEEGRQPGAADPGEECFRMGSTAPWEQLTARPGGWGFMT